MSTRLLDTDRRELYKLESGVEVVLGHVLDRGRQGAIREVIGEPHLAAKIFALDEAMPNWRFFRHLRVSQHVKSDARRWFDDNGVPRLAWPIAILTASNDEPAGYLMVRLNAPWRKLDDVLSDRDRAAFDIAMSWRDLVTVAFRLADLVHDVHEAARIVGDLSSANVMVAAGDRRVAFVDCDDMIDKDDAQESESRPLTTERYGAPELHLERPARFSAATDAWALAVLIVQLLQDGVHPFAGAGRFHGTPKGVLPNVADGRTRFKRPGWIARAPWDASWLPVDTLPPELLELARRCLVDGRLTPALRPTPSEWARAIGRVGVRNCGVRSNHVFSEHLEACPWCEHVQRGQPDPFGATAGVPR